MTTAWWDATQTESMICQSTQELIPQDVFVSCGNQVKKTTKKTLMLRFFDIKFGTIAEGVIAEPRERTADSLLSDLESVALSVEGSYLGITEDNFVPSARCINDIKERQLVTSSSIPRLRCCVCHLRHKRAMNAPADVRQISKR